MTLTTFPYDWKYYKDPTEEFLDFLTSIAIEMYYDMNDLSWDHNDPDECKNLWNAGGNWKHKKIVGKMINQSYRYDYVGEKCSGLIELSDEWNDGLDLTDFKNISILGFKFNKETHEITYHKQNSIQ